MTEQKILDNAPNSMNHHFTLNSGESGYINNTTGTCRALSDIKRIAELEDSLETERCRLAACGVVANANTRETAATQRVMHEDYKSASLLDVIRAVDTEIEQRERIAELEKLGNEMAIIISDLRAHLKIRGDA